MSRLVISESVLIKLRGKRGAMPAPANRSKYGNKVTIGYDLDGGEIKFHSVREAKRWADLLIRYRKGEVRNVQRQVPYRFEVNGIELRAKPRKKLGHAVKYVADFVYEEANRNGVWLTVVEDAKGMRTDAYKIKWALMKACHGIEVRET